MSSRGTTLGGVEAQGLDSEPPALIRGGGRPVLRAVLGVVLLGDVAALFWGHFYEPPLPEVLPYEPQVFVHLHSEVWALGVLFGIAIVALAAFIRGTRTLLSGTVAFVAIFFINESYTAIVESPRRMFFSTGSMLLGWLVGLAYAKWRGYDRAHGERLAEYASLGGIAATYTGAGIQKVINGALFQASSLRGHIYTHHPVGGTSVFDDIAYAVAESPTIAAALSFSVVVIQFGAFLVLVGPRLRMIWGSLLICFHFGTLFFLNIIYVEATVLLFAFCFPWWRLRDRLSPGKDGDPLVNSTTEVRDPRVGRSQILQVGAVILGAILVFAALPMPRYLDRPDVHPYGPPPAGRPGDVRAFGPIEHQQVYDGWKVAYLEVRKEEALVSLEHPSGDAVRIAFREPRQSDHELPWDGEGVRFYHYRTDLPVSRFEGPIRAMLTTLKEHASGDIGTAVRGWIDDPERYSFEFKKSR